MASWPRNRDLEHELNGLMDEMLDCEAAVSYQQRCVGRVRVPSGYDDAACDENVVGDFLSLPQGDRVNIGRAPYFGWMALLPINASSHVVLLKRWPIGFFRALRFRRLLSRKRNGR